MLCDNYEKLSHPEKVQFIGKLCHAAQSDNSLFSIAEEIIRLGETRGIFDRAKILPNHPENNKDENTKPK